MLLLCAVVFLALVPTGGAQHPQCRWACDDPVCHAICRPVCEPPRCEAHCTEPHTCTVKPKCRTACDLNGDVSETEACPSCETHCDPLPQHCAAHECSPLCEAPVCGWVCEKPPPSLCAKPRCELQCEQPTCAHEGPPPKSATAATHVVAGFLLLAVLAASVF
jgi:hypothetical protein